MEKRGREMKKIISLLTMVFILFLTACSGGSQEETSAETPNDGEKQLTKVSQVTNWFAEAEHGGQYAALTKGFYEEKGLDMTIEPGGPQVSAIQLVSTGEHAFGMADADTLLMARAEGIPLVAIATVFQKNPLALFTHEGDVLTTPEDLSGRTLYKIPGLPYWDYIQSKYKPKNVTELAYSGSITPFIENENAVNQGYITAESHALEAEGISYEANMLADFAGYNPYVMMLFTTEDYIKEHPDIVQAYVEASVEGWEYYKDHSDEINPVIQEDNPDMSLDWFNYSAEKSRELIFGGDAKIKGFGYMSEERWETLKTQLVEAGVIDDSVDVTQAFTNEFLPE